MVVVKIMSEDIFFPVCSNPAFLHFDDENYLLQIVFLFLQPSLWSVFWVTFPIATESKRVLA